MGDPTAGLDEYESKYLGGAALLAHARDRNRFLAVAAPAGSLVSMLAMILVVANSPHGPSVLPLVTAVLMAVLMLTIGAVASVLHAVQRVTVSARELRVERGLLSRVIPIASITRVVTTADRPFRATPFVVSRSTEAFKLVPTALSQGPGTVSSVGSGEGCLCVEFIDDKGAARRHYLRTSDAEALRAGVELARSGDAGTGVRADTSEEQGEEQGVEAKVSAGERSRTA